MMRVGATWHIAFDVSLEICKTALWLTFVVYAILALHAVTQLPSRLDRCAAGIERINGMVCREIVFDVTTGKEN